MKTAFLKNKNITLSSINKQLLIVFVTLCLGYVGTQVYVTSSVGTKSQEVDEVRQEKAQLRLENEILISKIDSANSLTAGDKLAEQYKLEQKSVQFLKEQNSDVALQNP